MQHKGFFGLFALLAATAIILLYAQEEAARADLMKAGTNSTMEFQAGMLWRTELEEATDRAIGNELQSSKPPLVAEEINSRVNSKILELVSMAGHGGKGFCKKNASGKIEGPEGSLGSIEMNSASRAIAIKSGEISIVIYSITGWQEKFPCVQSPGKTKSLFALPANYTAFAAVPL